MAAQIKNSHECRHIPDASETRLRVRSVTGAAVLTAKVPSKATGLLKRTTFAVSEYRTRIDRSGILPQ
jgi:hypothetical protein